MMSTSRTRPSSPSAQSRAGVRRPDHRVRHEDHLGGHHARRSGRAAAGRRCGRAASNPDCGDCWSAWSPDRTRCSSASAKTSRSSRYLRPRTRCSSTASPAISPSSSAFRKKATTSIRATLDVRQAPALHQPGLPDADLLLQALSGQRAGHRGGRARLSPAGNARGVGAVRLRGGDARARGCHAEKFELIERFKFFHELAWKRRVARQAAAAASRALSLQPRRLSLAGRDVVHALAGSRAEAVMSTPQRVLLINPTHNAAAQRALPARHAQSDRGSRRAACDHAHRWQRRSRLHRHRCTRGERGQRRCASASASWAGRSCPRRSQLSKADARGSASDCRSSGAALSRPVCPDATLNAPYVDYAVQRRRARTRSGELLQAAQVRRPWRELDHIDGLSWRRGGQIVHNRERHFSAASLTQRAALRATGEPAALPDPHLSRAPHRGLPGRVSAAVFAALSAAWQPCSAGRLALPTAARLEQDLRFLSEQLGRRRHPILRPQLLRSRSGHGAAAGGAGELRAALVVLRALRCAAQSVGELLAAGASKPACAWPTSARSRRATGCCTTCARARVPTRRSPRSSYVTATAWYRSCPSCSRRRRIRKARPSAPSSSSARSSARYPETEIMLYVYTPLPARPGTHARRPRARRPCATARDIRCVSRPLPMAGPSRSGSGLLVPHGFALDLGCVARAHPRFHDRARLPLPDDHRHPLAALGQAHVERAGVLALPLPPLRPAMGTGPLEEVHPPARPARLESVTADPRDAQATVQLISR